MTQASLGQSVVQKTVHAQQNNGERSKVQPGNNAPMWRAVGAGQSGFKIGRAHV